MCRKNEGKLVELGADLRLVRNKLVETLDVSERLCHTDISGPAVMYTACDMLVLIREIETEVNRSIEKLDWLVRNQ